MKVTNYIKEPLIDKKINGKSWMAVMTIDDYLRMVDLDNNPYQRTKLGIKPYTKLIEDLLDGTLIPPISVVYNESDLDLDKELDETKKFIILDGLQRTNCIIYCKNLIEQGKSTGSINNIQDFLSKLVYVEIWEKLGLKEILYKMVVLNTGQKKMDYSHQLEILNESVRYELESKGINIITNKEIKEGMPKKDSFELSDITEGLVSFINGVPISGKKDAAEFLFERLNIGLNSGEKSNTMLELVYNDKTYFYLVWTLKDFNSLLNLSYGCEENPFKKYNTFMISFLASLGYALKKNPQNLETKIKILENKLRHNYEDPLNLQILEGYYNKFKSGIGEKRRKFVFEAFKDFFLSKDYVDEIEWSATYERFF